MRDAQVRPYDSIDPNLFANCRYQRSHGSTKINLKGERGSQDQPRADKADRLLAPEILIDARFENQLGEAGLSRRHWQLLNLLEDGPRSRARTAEAERTLPAG